MKDSLRRIKDLISGQKDLTSLGIVDIVSNAIGAVFWFYIASVLGAEQYGKISYFIAIAGIASTISLLGGQNTLTVYTAKNIKIQSTVYLLTICSGLVASAVLFFTLGKTEISLLVISYIILNLAISEILGRKLFSDYAKYVIVNKILTVIFGIGLYYLIGFEGIIFGIALASFPYIIRIYHGFKETSIDFSLLKTKTGFMITSYLTNLAEAFNGSLDKIIIAPLLGYALLGNYQLGIQFLSILHILPSIVFKFTLPHDASGNHNIKLKKLAVISSVIIGVLGIVVSPILIPIVFPKYSAAIQVIQIVSLSVVPTTVSLMYASRFLGLEKNKINLFSSGLFLGVQTIGIIILGKQYGANGAAIAFDISTIVHMIFYIIADRLFGEKPKCAR